jgi:hypothetical protein
MSYKTYIVCFFCISLYPLVEVPLSVGDFLDKHSILTIKVQYMPDTEKQKNVLHELLLLEAMYKDIIHIPGLKELYHLLIDVNQQLWDIESKKRACEADGIQNIILKVKNNETLSPNELELLLTFLSLARQVYIQNDQRARIKKVINILSGSDIIEEKSHF